MMPETRRHSTAGQVEKPSSSSGAATDNERSNDDVTLGLGYLAFCAHDKVPSERGVLYFNGSDLVKNAYMVDQDENSTKSVVDPDDIESLSIIDGPHSEEELQRLTLPLLGLTLMTPGSVLCGDFFGFRGFMRHTFFRLQEQGDEGEVPLYILLDHSVKHIFADQHTVTAFPIAAPPSRGGPAVSFFSEDWYGSAVVVGVNRVFKEEDSTAVDGARLCDLYEPNGTATALLKDFLTQVEGLGFPMQHPLHLDLYPYFKAYTYNDTDSQ